MNPQTNQTVKTGPKDFFLHLGATLVLYVSVIALINLAFAIINHAFPDALSYDYFTGSIAWPISILVVLVPTLFILGWLIRKDVLAIPEKENLWIRRWRIFLTLFLTGATIIGDLIVLINTYLNGEISERFFYKFLVILVIFGIVFSYYILERKGTKRKVQMALASIGGLLVIASIVAGFIIVGSPAKQRAIRFDGERVNDLRNIQWQIISAWQSKGKIPATLADLHDFISGYIVPTDPENKNAYEYSVKSPMSFELCATFAEPTQVLENENWKHVVGHTCFTRTIDPVAYPIIKRPTSEPY